MVLSLTWQCLAAAPRLRISGSGVARLRPEIEWFRRAVFTRCSFHRLPLPVRCPNRLSTSAIWSSP